MDYPLSGPYEQAKAVLMGVPDEGGSRSYRKGSSEAPDEIRKIANERDVFGEERYGFSPSCKWAGLRDAGNISKKEVKDIVSSIAKGGKVPIVLGGDHSISYEVVKGIQEAKSEKLSIIYFDAHPDLVSSEERYYGSVFGDILKLENVEPKRSVLVGARSIEEEEMAKLNEWKLLSISPWEIEERGIKRVVEEIIASTLKEVYVSIDVDVVDPAFAPASSTPVPGGLSSRELLYGLSRICKKKKLVGMDITEYVPSYDVNGITGHLCSRMLFSVLCNLGEADES